jgi:hypothetical protein
VQHCRREFGRESGEGDKCVLDAVERRSELLGIKSYCPQDRRIIPRYSWRKDGVGRPWGPVDCGQRWLSPAEVTLMLTKNTVTDVPGVARRRIRGGTR